jgi:UDP-2-acetamido-2,6-beta-L-arabino-hexul-4-ose reductase
VACETTGSKPHILFSSSTQEEKDNLYGRSKKEGRILFEKWANESGSGFTGLIIPNVFGSFGHPYYNSVVATFCHQLTHNEIPKIDIDGELKLVYVGEVVDFILQKVNEQYEKPTQIENFLVPFKYSIKVSELLTKLKTFKEQYFENGMIPDLNNSLDRNLFNTLITYLDHKSFFPFLLKLNTDERGSFVETVKLNSGGQISFSTTKPGITRGNHFHTRKAERFAVIKGRARIELRRIGTTDKLSFELDGRSPSFVDMPIWYTHNITNIGAEDVFTIFWISEHFNASDPDTFFEQV